VTAGDVAGGDVTATRVVGASVAGGAVVGAAVTGGAEVGGAGVVTRIVVVTSATTPLGVSGSVDPHAAAAKKGRATTNGRNLIK